MKQKARRLTFRLACVLGFHGLWSSVGFAQTYTITVIESPVQGATSALGINDSGMVAGSYFNGSSFVAYRWNAPGTLTDLGRFPGVPAGQAFSSFATAINTAGQVTGQATTADGSAHAFLWTNGVMTDIGTLGGTASTALDLNDSGAVVGYSLPASGSYQRAFEWKNGAISPIPAPAGSVEHWAHGINGNGQVVGTSYEGNAPRAILFDGTTTRRLGEPTGDTLSQAMDINSAGEAVGFSGAAGPSRSRAVRWNPDGSVTVLGTLTGDTEAVANAINDRGHIVGSSGSDSQGNAFLFCEAEMHDLNDCIPPGGEWTITEALDINNRGQIVGNASRRGTQRGVILTPIYGDANGDFAVTMADVALLMRVTSGLTALPCYWIADTAPNPSALKGGFGDGRLNILDVVRTVRYVQKKETHWP